MKIEYFKGDVRDTEAFAIMHQVNCYAMGSGVAKALYEKWPKVKTAHQELVSQYKEDKHEVHPLLGMVQPVYCSAGMLVFNMFGEQHYGYDGKKYTSYDALDTCFNKVARYCTEHRIERIAMPAKLGCVRGGGKWAVVLTLLEEAFKRTGITIEIWEFDKG